MGAVASKSFSNNARNSSVPKRKFSDFYILAESIGIGSFASVHRCFRKSDLAEFAVKIINKNFLTPKELHGLQSEMQILRHLSHKNVIELIDIFTNKRNVSMVLELCDGKDLFDQIVASKSTRFTESKTAEIMYTLCDALDYIHSNGVVHRDVKPENILFGVDGTLKVTDFGLAYFNATISNGLDSPSSSSSCDDIYMNTCCGTPHYVAPEVICGEPYDARCDLWSLGVMLYIMLVGYQPFRADSLKQMYEKIAKGKYDFASKRWKKVSLEAKDLVRGLMEVEPKKRYSIADLKKHPFIAKYQP